MKITIDQVGPVNVDRVPVVSEYIHVKGKMHKVEFVVHNPTTIYLYLDSNNKPMDCFLPRRI